MEETAVIFKDETMTGMVKNHFSIKVLSKTIKIKDLIKSRVYHEVEEYNQSKSLYFKGLVQPLDSESVEGQLNGYKLKEPKLIDAERQYYLALSAFKKNAFFMLINNQQCDDLEEEITIHNNISVSFIRLTALVGG